MISLSDSQLRAVMSAASALEPEKRDLYLRRISAMLVLRGRGHFTDSDVDDAVKRALVGMIHENAA